MLYRLPPEVEHDLMFDSTDQQNREALLETVWRFHLDSRSQDTFEEEIEDPQTLQLDEMLQLNSQRRCWYEVPTGLMSTATPYDDFYRHLYNYYFTYEHLTLIREKYWPEANLQNTQVWERIASPQAFEANQIITGDGQKRKLFKFFQEIGWLTAEEVNQFATKRATKQSTYLCLSRNPIDMLMISTNQSFTSCMSLASNHSEAFYMGLPGFICDPNRILAFLTTGKLKTYDLCGQDIKHFGYIERAWQIATPFGFNFGRPYPHNDVNSVLKKFVQEVLPLRGSTHQGARSIYPVPMLFWEDRDEQCLGYCDECDLDESGHWSFYGARGGSTPFQHDRGFANIPTDFNDACAGGMRCYCCDDRVSEDDYYSAEDEVWCERCYYDRFSTCQRCEETTRHDDLCCVQTGRSAEEYWCEDCADRYASTCYHCGGLWADYRMLTAEDGDGDAVYVCSDCQDRVENCAICDTLYVDADHFHRPDNGDIPWCGNCFDDEAPTECDNCGEFTSEAHPCGCPIESETQDELELESEDENALQPATA